MRYSVVASAIIGAASALGIPRRAHDQRCVPLSKSDVPVPTPNTPETFANFPYYGITSSYSTTPSGFQAIFTNQTAAIRSYKYMHYLDLAKYEVAQCAASCDASPGCDAFNIFFLRHPAIEPAVACPNPKANTLVRCTLWSQPIQASEALNKGQGRGPVDANGQAFQVLIAGSNAYNRVSRSSPIKSAPTTITVTQSQSRVSATAPSTATVTQTVTATTSTSSTSAVSTAWPHTSTLTTAATSAKTTESTRTVLTLKSAASTASPHLSTLAVAAAVQGAATSTHKL